jgi:hypothetical protein
MASLGLEEHLFGHARLGRRAHKAIQLAIEGENPPTGPWAEFDADLFERGMDPEFLSSGFPWSRRTSIIAFK